MPAEGSFSSWVGIGRACDVVIFGSASAVSKLVSAIGFCFFALGLAGQLWFRALAPLAQLFCSNRLSGPFGVVEKPNSRTIVTTNKASMDGEGQPFRSRGIFHHTA